MPLRNTACDWCRLRQAMAVAVAGLLPELLLQHAHEVMAGARVITNAQVLQAAQPVHCGDGCMTMRMVVVVGGEAIVVGQHDGGRRPREKRAR